MGVIDDGSGIRSVFVTVGTTSFDALVKTVDTQEVKEKLYSKGYTHLLIQMGRGSFIPTNCIHLYNMLFLGSGSIFESLRLGKPLIVVVNEDLMDNHQSELAEELAERKHLFCGSPQTLLDTIETMDLDALTSYPPADAKPLAKLINRFLGFHDD
ncbi:N-acetylglucosaminyldiphosphodolichol N-acetylglucosaminyltransferase [Ranunculus cassubicifolius]